MKILVWGLGYVGTVAGACLAQLGHDVIGVDPVAAKVTALNEGKSSFYEPGLEPLIQAQVKSGRLRATADGTDLISSADISFICVGTPSAPNGDSSLQYLEAVAAQIGQGLRRASNYHVVVLRSTVFAGTTRDVLLSLLEQHSQRRCGQDFGLVMNPEFLRESSAIADFFAPPYTVIGEFDQQAGDLVAELYQGVSGEVYRVPLEIAELLKLTNNAFHALKVGFANEVGRLCDNLTLDGRQLMELVCADSKLNLSAAYMRPGFAFGGSCLPKDLRSITFHSQRLGVKTPILDSILLSNQRQIEAARLRVHQLGVKHLTILGLSFKADTDDLRESPVIKLIQELWRDGLHLSVYDPNVRLEEMTRDRQEYMRCQLPQIAQIYCPTLDEAISQGEAIILAQNHPELRAAIEKLPKHIAVLDLVKSPSMANVSDLDEGNEGSVLENLDENRLIQV